LQKFASEGFRTLCFAKREIPEEQYRDMMRKFSDVPTDPKEKEQTV
jgi:hypothetical protein